MVHLIDCLPATTIFAPKVPASLVFGRSSYCTVRMFLLYIAQHTGPLQNSFSSCRLERCEYFIFFLFVVVVSHPEHVSRFCFFADAEPQVLSTKMEDFAEFGKRLEKVGVGPVVVHSSRELEPIYSIVAAEYYKYITEREKISRYGNCASPNISSVVTMESSGVSIHASNVSRAMNRSLLHCLFLPQAATHFWCPLSVVWWRRHPVNLEVYTLLPPRLQPCFFFLI